MDDLGAGESNLVRLATLPFHLVKLDRELWGALRDQPLPTLTMLDSLIQVGNGFGWGVVVEGLEMFEMTSFHFSIDPIHLQTELGALAYLVHNTLSAREELYIKEEDCPITRFLIEREWQDSEAMKWHHQLHEGVFDPQVAQQLLQWMAQTVSAEKNRWKTSCDKPLL